MMYAATNPSPIRVSAGESRSRIGGSAGGGESPGSAGTAGGEAFVPTKPREPGGESDGSSDGAAPREGATAGAAATLCGAEISWYVCPANPAPPTAVANDTAHFCHVGMPNKSTKNRVKIDGRGPVSVIAHPLSGVYVTF
jgi:hypothetical protein